MATLDDLKQALRQKATATASSATQPLSDSQYDAGFNILGPGGSGRTSYQDFVIPQLSQLVAPLCNSRSSISVLEIGPGPKSILGSLSSGLRQRVKRYVAFEPNELFATRMAECFRSNLETESPLPCLESPPEINSIPFGLDSNTRTNTVGDGAEKFDLILFCHSMYGMQPKNRFIEEALEMLVQQPQVGMVVVYHRDGMLNLEGLVCHRTASFPTGVARVGDGDESLDCFAPFIAGFVMQDVDTDMAVKAEWRKVCRALGRREKAYPNHLSFNSPEIMAAFTRHAITLTELTAQVLVVTGDYMVKNREARLHHPASIIRPTEVRHIQQCIRWALDHGLSLTVVGGGHSGQCLWSNVVAIDMGAFDQVHVLKGEQDGRTSDSNTDPLVVIESGCKSGDIVHKAMTAGLTVPMGGRPSVGAGLWLQGGIGHLARLHGLACDAIVGAVLVSVASGQILCVGRVPSQHWPAGAVRPENEADLLWALRGAGTNVGIVVSVTFKAYPAPVYSVWNWAIPMSDRDEARLKLSDLDESIARNLPRACCVDAYVYWDSGKLCIGVTLLEASTTNPTLQTPTSTPTPVDTILGPASSSKTVDGIGLFETELYMSGMHGGHAGGKTSSFKRCLFLKHIGASDISGILVAAIENRTSPFCYLHLLHGGGAISDVPENDTAFGCRDWDFACVITGVWPRDQDGTEVARDAVQWVYNVAMDLLSLSVGAYGADLGPDPRDASLAANAFGPNVTRLARLKHTLDPSNVLAYACPLPKAPTGQKLIVLVTGEHGAGKDHFTHICVSTLTACGHKARAVSISDETKREYAAATGADLQRLLQDRAYKEQQRPALTAFFQDQVRHRPQLPEEHFLNVLSGAADVDALLITGMRDEAPVAAFSYLVPDTRVIEVRVKASRETRKARRDGHGSDDDDDVDVDDTKDDKNGKDCNIGPTLIFNNDKTGNEAAKRFCEDSLFPFFHEDLRRLTDMVRAVTDFPSPGIEFRDVLGIAQQPGGLALCTSLLQRHFTGDWTKVDVMACCETGGLIFASALAPRVDVPLALVREAGKLPPPTISAVKSASYISSSVSRDSVEKTIEIGENVIPRGASVVVVDDVLATGETLCAVLQLLCEVGVSAEDIHVLVVAEFPVHRGRQLLRQRGFGGVKIQSLLIYGGA